jgi:hypothetical protein
MIKKIALLIVVISGYLVASQFVVDKKKKVPVKTLQEKALNKAITVMKKMPQIQRSFADLQEQLQEVFLRCAEGDKTVVFASKKADILEKEINATAAILDAFERLDSAIAHYCLR